MEYLCSRLGSSTHGERKQGAKSLYSSMNDKNLIQTKQTEKREGKLDKILAVVAL
jgi:hypothetical protein